LYDSQESLPASLSNFVKVLYDFVIEIAFFSPDVFNDRLRLKSSGWLAIPESSEHLAVSTKCGTKAIPFHPFDT
jgi:hypothetical protein